MSAALAILDTNRHLSCDLRATPAPDWRDVAIFPTRSEADSAYQRDSRIIRRVLYTGAWAGWIVGAQHKPNAYLRTDGRYR